MADDFTVRALTPETWDAFAALVEKHNGIFAFDYARGIIIELHAGIQEVMGLGVKTLPVDVPVQTISRRQVVYTTKSIE